MKIVNIRNREAIKYVLTSRGALICWWKTGAPRIHIIYLETWVLQAAFRCPLSVTAQIKRVAMNFI